MRTLLSRRQVVAFIFAIAVLITGLGLTAALYRAQTFLVAIEGSEPTNLPASKLNFTVGGVIAENFVTAAPVGAAFLSWRYSHPVRLQYITQTVVGPVDGSRAVRGVSVQYRDERGVWTEVLRASWSETEATRPHVLSFPEPSSLIAAAEWRLLALEGGRDDETIIGFLSPVLWNSSGAMALVNSLALDVLMFLSFFLAAVTFAVFNRKKAGFLLFWGGCIAVIVVMNVVTFWLIRLPILWAPDSLSYTVWPPFFSRMPGMNLIYVSLLRLMNFDQLHVLQINIMVLSYFAALNAIAVTMKRYWPFVPLTVFPLSWGNLVYHGSYILSEAWFISGLLIALSGLMSIVMGGGRKSAVWTGAGLLLTVCVKPVGAILIIPGILAYRFMSYPRPRQLLALAILPATLGYFVMSAYGYTVSGRFTPTSFEGISLSGYVAWMLDPNQLPEKYRDVGVKTVAELQEIYSALPPMSEPERFVDFTVEKINAALYLILLPRFTRAVAMASPELSKEVPAEWWMANRYQLAKTNDLLAKWAWNSIARNPARYVFNCILNYWALWRDSFVNYYTVGQWWRWRLYWAAYRLDDPEVRRFLPAEYNEYANRWRQATESHLIVGREFRLSSVRIHEFHRYIGWSLMIVSLVFSVMYVIPIRYNPCVAGMIIWALFVNAMFAGHVLFNTALPRYAEPMVALLPLLAALALFWFSQLARFSLPVVAPSLWNLIQLSGDLRKALLWPGPRRAQ